jgi:hypothetical protein
MADVTLQTDLYDESASTVSSLQTELWTPGYVSTRDTVDVMTDLWSFNPVDQTGRVLARPIYFR